MPSEDEDFKSDPIAFISDRLAELKLLSVGDDLTAAYETPEHKTLVVSRDVASMLAERLQLSSKAPKWKIKGSTVAKSKRKRGHAN